MGCCFVSLLWQRSIPPQCGGNVCEADKGGRRCQRGTAFSRDGGLVNRRLITLSPKISEKQATTQGRPYRHAPQAHFFFHIINRSQTEFTLFFLQAHSKSRGQLPLSCEAALFRLNYYFERMELGSRNAEALFCRAAKLKFYSCYVYIIH